MIEPPLAPDKEEITTIGRASPDSDAGVLDFDGCVQLPRVIIRVAGATTLRPLTKWGRRMDHAGPREILSRPWVLWFSIVNGAIALVSGVLAITQAWHGRALLVIAICAGAIAIAIFGTLFKTPSN
jgi:hypothetical protein